MSTNHMLTVKEKIGYGLGDTASNLYFQMYINFLLFYYTDVFGIPAAVTGTLFLLSRFWDAVNDPMMGIIADRTNTRWGKFRPYLIWIMVPLAVVGVLMFTTPDLDMRGKILYAYITYTLMMMAYTAINIPYSALLGVLSPDSKQRTSASTYRFVLAFAGAFIVQGATLPLVNYLGNEDQGFSLANDKLVIQEVNNSASRIIIEASDGTNTTSNEFLVKINRTGEQPPSVDNPLNDMILEEGFGSRDIDFSTVFSDLDGSDLAYEVSSSNADVVLASISGTKLTLQEKAIGSADIDLAAVDGNIGRKSSKFKVSVFAKGNYPPVRITALQDTSFNISTDEEKISLNRLFNDPDGDALNYTVTSSNLAAINAEIDNENLVLQLQESGISQIVLTAFDNKGGMAADSFYVKAYSDQNDPPAIYHKVQNIELAEGFKEYTVNIAGVFADLDGDKLSYTVRKVDVSKGFQYTLIVFGFLACILFYLTFISTKERVHPPKDQQTSLKNDLRDLVHNRPWMILLFMGIFTLGYVIIRIGTIIYYFKYYIGDEILTSLFMVTGTLGVIVGVALTDVLSRKLGKKKLYLYVMGLSSLLTMLFYFIPKEQIAMIFVVHILISLVMAPQAPLLWAMYADTADYSEWKNGRRATGLIFSAATFAQKFGMALGGGIAGWLLAMFNFQPNIQQSIETLTGIRLMMSFIPAIGSALAMGFAFFYELDDNKMVEIEKDLAARKLQQEAAG